jgi:hypothetical protein
MSADIKIIVTYHSGGVHTHEVRNVCKEDVETIMEFLIQLQELRIQETD